MQEVTVRVSKMVQIISNIFFAKQKKKILVDVVHTNNKNDDIISTATYLFHNVLLVVCMAARHIL